MGRAEKTERPHSDAKRDGRSDAASLVALPRPVSSLVGRDEEIAAIAGALADSRLVTLVGAPGIGKTRLGIEVAHERARTGVETARFVELAPLMKPEMVAPAAAAAFSLSEVAGREPVDALIAYLRPRAALLVLDNCEHVLGECTRLADTLLRDCPDLRILTTGREALSSPAERVWRVPPLSVPDHGTEEISPEALMDYDAVCLFVERAAARSPGFSLNRYVARAVTEICRRLDGIPLAIELAAARVDGLTPAEIAHRLDDRFSLLCNGGNAGLPHQQTLLEALDWSHALLTAPERVLLRRLSVFAGSFDLEAAQAVCAGGELERPVIGGLLGRLSSRSLLVADGSSPTAPRFRLLETVRAYARDRLDGTGEAGALREAHARVHLTLAERAEHELTGPDQRRWLKRLEVAHDDLRLALEWCLGHDRGEWALRLAGSLVLFWRVHCHFREGRDLLTAAVAAGDGAAPALQARALWGAGFLTHMAGDPGSEAVPLLQQSLDLYREQGHRRGCARALLVLGNCGQMASDPAARSQLSESAAMAREADDAWCLAHALACAGFDHAAHQDLPAARRLFEESVAIARAARDDQSLRAGLIGLGKVVLHQGEYDTAESLLGEAVAVSEALGETYSAATALQYLAELAFGRGEYAGARDLADRAMSLLPDVAPSGSDLGIVMLLGRVSHAQGDRASAQLRFEDGLARSGAEPAAYALLCLGELVADEGKRSEALRLFEQARELAQARGDHGSRAWALHALGGLARTAGDARQAATLHSKVLRLQRTMGDLPGIAASLEAIAGLAAAGGRSEHAARLFGAAGALREKGGYARHPWESARCSADLAGVRERLPGDELARALAAGSELSRAQAIAEALKGRERRSRSAGGWASLSDTERRVAELVAEGLTNRMIAERMFVSLGTVKAHLTHIFTQFGVSRRSELVREVCHQREPALSDSA